MLFPIKDNKLKDKIALGENKQKDDDITVNRWQKPIEIFFLIQKREFLSIFPKRINNKSILKINQESVYKLVKIKAKRSFRSAWDVMISSSFFF